VVSVTYVVDINHNASLREDYNNADMILKCFISFGMTYAGREESASLCPNLSEGDKSPWYIPFCSTLSQHLSTIRNSCHMEDIVDN
jgi:hypothetical protein